MDAKQLAPIAPNKGLLATFVRDAVEFETRKHTLKRAIEHCTYHKRSIESNNSNYVSKTLRESETKLAEARKKLQRLLDEQKNISSNLQQRLQDLSENIRTLSSYSHKDFRKAYPKIFLSTSGTFFSLLLFAGIGTLPLSLITACLLSAYFYFVDTALAAKQIEVIAVFCITASAILSCIIGLVWIKTDERKSRQEILSKAKEKYKEAEADFAKSQQHFESKFLVLAGDVASLEKAHKDLLANIEKENKSTKQQTDFLDQQLTVMQSDLDTIENQLQQFYSVNLISPDYRFLDCVLALHQIFRNDLADTMREAILLYDERVFRGEMIRGLENIYHAINDLGGLMSETVHQLKTLNRNAQNIADNIRDVSAQLAQNSDAISSINQTVVDSADHLSRQYEYSHYANDAIRANTDRLVWYEEQRRQGLL